MEVRNDEISFIAARKLHLPAGRYWQMADLVRCDTLWLPKMISIVSVVIDERTGNGRILSTAVPGRRDDGRTLANSRKHPATAIQEIIVQTNTFLSFPKRQFARFCANKIIAMEGASNAPPDRISLISDGVSIIIILYRVIRQACRPPFSSLTMNLLKIWKHLNMIKDYKLSNSRDYSYYLRSIRWTANKLLFFFFNENPLTPLLKYTKTRSDIKSFYVLVWPFLWTISLSINIHFNNRNTTHSNIELGISKFSRIW